MDGQTNLNPAPAPNPADVNAPKPLPIANPVEASGQAAPSGLWMGAFAAFRQAFEQIKKNPQPAILFVVVYVLLSVVSLVTNDGKSQLEASYDSYESLTTIIFLLALPVYALAIADKKSITLAEFMKFDLKRFWYLIVTVVLTIVIFTLSFVAFVIPLIWTIAWYFSTQYVLVDQKLGPVKALSESKRISKNHKAKVWGLIGASILLAIPVFALTFVPVIGAVAGAFYSVLLAGASAVLYRWLHQQSPVEQL